MTNKKTGNNEKKPQKINESIVKDTGKTSTRVQNNNQTTTSTGPRSPRNDKK